jgi:hypothetical protein
MINTARLAERWREAAGDPVRMAAVLVEELAQEDNRLVTRADLRAEVNGLKYWMLSRLIAMFAVSFSIALTIIGFMIRYFPPAAGG